jgi:hypothetical protein
MTLLFRFLAEGAAWPGGLKTKALKLSSETFKLINYKLNVWGRATMLFLVVLGSS